MTDSSSPAAIDPLDALMARFPALRCPNCKFTAHADNSSFVFEVTTTQIIKSVDIRTKRILVSGHGESVEWNDMRVFCENCQNEFPFPSDWAWEYHDQY